jgi:hypothetical protein
MTRRTLLSVFLASPAFAQDGSVRVRADAPLAESQPQVLLPPEGFIELHRLRLANRRGGPIEVSLDAGRSWQTLGRVLRPATTTAEGHIAAEYAPPGTVAAVAIHGIRMRISADDGMLHAPRLLSIVPREFLGDFKLDGYGGIVAASAGIGTDIPAGASIFRGLAPLCGNPIYMEDSSGRYVPMPPTYLPDGKGEIFLIPVWAPKRRLSEVTFENRPGGAVSLIWADRKVEQVAIVCGPLKGVGRFDGTAFTGTGRINTNHTGVITIGTAPIDARDPEGVGRERRGGFQISPAWHNSRCAEAGAPMVLTVGRANAAGRPDHHLRSLEGVAPLFKDHVPLMSSGAVCECSIDGGGWEPLPPLVGSIPDGLTAAGLKRFWRSQGDPRTCQKGITALRIRFPQLTPETSKKLASIAIGEYKKMRLAAARSGEARIVKGILALTATPPGSEQVSFVRLMVDGRARGFTNVRPFVISWDTTTVPDGEYVVEAQALDENGSVLSTSAKRVYVLNASG